MSNTKRLPSSVGLKKQEEFIEVFATRWSPYPSAAADPPEWKSTP